MSMSDPIADFVTRVRNGGGVGKSKISVPYSKLKHQMADILKSEGYVTECEVVGEVPKKSLVLTMKYGPDGDCVIHHIRRVSKPGRRLYKKKKELRRVLSGLGIGIISTSRGLRTDKQCRRENVGGEYLIEVW